MLYSSNHIRMNGFEGKMLVDNYLTYKYYYFYF